MRDDKMTVAPSVSEPPKRTRTATERLDKFVVRLMDQSEPLVRHRLDVDEKAAPGAAIRIRFGVIQPKQ